MRCWNCNKRVLEGAKVCRFCEAALTDAPTPEEIDVAQEMLQAMPPEVLEEMRETFRDSSTAEDFANRILVGPCPRCHSDQTGNCENDPEINDILVGRCYECGQLWCTECEQLLERQAPHCSCWAEEE